MHPPRTLGQIFRIFALLASSSPQPAHANYNREDLCGLSVHAADFPDIGGFSVIDGAFTVPQVAPQNVAPHKSVTSYLYAGVALCCGKDCSTRLEAGVRTWSPSPSDQTDYTAEFMFQLSPTFGPVVFPKPHRLDLNASDTFWTRIEVKSSTLAQVKYWKSITPTTNLTVEADLLVSRSTDGDRPQLTVTTRGYGVGEEISYSMKSVLPDAAEPSLCGDSAWWYLADNAGPLSEDGSQRGRLSRFSPVLVGGHGLQTTNNRSFPADLPLSGMARLWNMVRTIGGRTEELCNARGFIDTGMTVLHAPHAWGM